MYVKNRTLDALEVAYSNLLSNDHYDSFVENTKLKLVDGIWDDHDLGVNDAGILPDRLDRANLYTNFLGLSGSEGSGNVEDWTSQVSEREGLYHVRNVDTRDEEGGAFMKIIFLDTRYARAPHYIRSLGEISLPGTALIAAALRVSYTFLGLGSSYFASMLGEKQWTWLEETLRESERNGEADYHVIVSSVQVLTTNPAVESWGHFPVEKSRLLSLLAKINPKGAVLLSGDVHHGEVASVGYWEEMPPEESERKTPGKSDDEFNDVAVRKEECAEGDHTCSHRPSTQEQKEMEKDFSQFGALANLAKANEDRVKKKKERQRQREEARSRARMERVERGRLFEVTSSGLTHTCGDGLITGLLCPLMLNTYDRHRIHSHGTDGYYIGRNFGQLRFDNESLEVSVRALPTGETMLQKVVLPSRVPVSRDDAELQIRPRDFFRLYRDAGLFTRMFVYGCLQYCVYILLKRLIKAVRIRLFPNLGNNSNAKAVAEEDEENSAVDFTAALPEGLARDQNRRAVSFKDEIEREDSEEEGEITEVEGEEDMKGELDYWRRRLYEGKDVPNEVYVDLETTEGKGGVMMTKRAKVNNAKEKTVDVEYVFDTPEFATVKTMQPTASSSRGVSESGGGRTLRLFFGVTLPIQVRSQIEESAAAAKAFPAAEGDVAIKWVPSANYHVTVKFVGETAEEDVVTLISRMEKHLAAASRECRPFRMAIKGAGAFPETGRPRILWAGVNPECAPNLGALRRAADKASFFSDDGDVLTPHVTVARCNANKKRSTQPVAAAMKYLEDNQESLTSDYFEVASVELYLSSSGQDSGGVEEFAGRSGSVYTVLHSFKL